MRRPAKLAVLLSLAGALALTGCGRPGTAAVVDGERITDAQVADLVADFERLGIPMTPQTALSNLIVTGPALELFEDAGLGATAQEGVAALDQAAEMNGVEPFEYSPSTVEFGRFAVVNSMVNAGAAPEAAGAFSDMVLSLDPEVNPRYGAWESMAGVTAVQQPWLVTTSDPQTLS